MKQLAVLIVLEVFKHHQRDMYFDEGVDTAAISDDDLRKAAMIGLRTNFERVQAIPPRQRNARFPKSLDDYILTFGEQLARILEKKYQQRREGAA